MYYLNLSSKNSKTGAIPVATIGRQTCPNACPLKGKGCYAEGGPLRIHWDKVSAGERGTTSFDEFCHQVEMMPKDQVWRYGQAGDLPGDGDTIDSEKLSQLTKANASRSVIAYTHKPATESNLEALRDAAKGGFNVNLSADDLNEADELADTGLPVVVVLPTEYGKKKNESIEDYNDRVKSLSFATPKGRKIAVCPATYLDVTCGQCLACSKFDRNEVVIGFPAHGNRTRIIDERLSRGRTDRQSTERAGDGDRPTL
jgi:hypothetical protein